MTADRPGGPPVTARMPLGLGGRLMDHQVLGREAEMLGKVDDVVLEERRGALVVTGVLRGPGAWAGRQPGVLGRWGQGTWRVLVPAEDPRPLVLPLDHVVLLDSAVHVDRWAEELLSQTDGLELWLRQHVVARIPGAREGEHRLTGRVATRPRSEPDLEMSADARLLSRLLACDVVGHDGTPRGRMVEVRARQVQPLDARVGPLEVTSLVHGRRRLGGETGYLEDRQMGPRLIGALVRWWHRRDAETPWSRVGAVDWANAVVHLAD